MKGSEKIKKYENLPLTLRDFYAGQAMAALMINNGIEDDLIGQGEFNNIAWDAFVWADAMLQRRDIKEYDEWVKWGDG